MSHLIVSNVTTENKTVEVVRIGTSQCYLGVRSHKNEDGVTWNTVSMYNWGDAGQVELESHEIPTPAQAAELIKLFSRFL